MAAGHMLPWAVLDAASGDVIGCTRYHDIVPAVDRVEIGYTFYAPALPAQPRQHRVQAAAARPRVRDGGMRGRGPADGQLQPPLAARDRGIGAKRDGVIRHHAPRRDGSARDTYIYSILVGEWPDVKRHLTTRLQRNSTSAR
jgi:hypothetical protein